MRRRTWIGGTGMRVTAATALVAALLAACGTKTTPPPGELIVAAQTDMSLPKDIDSVRFLVMVQGNKKFDQTFEAGPGGLKIPATLGVIAGHDPSVPVTLKVVGVKSHKSRVLREAITTVPPDRLAVVKMPLAWLCDGSAQDVVLDPVSGETDVTSSCPNGQSCVDGACVDANIDVKSLPNYVPAEIYGGGTGQNGDGACFDTLKCFDGAQAADVDLASCTIAAPAGGTANLNVALRRPANSDGICSSDGSLCVIPLDSGSSGWFPVSTSSGQRIHLPGSVCAKLASKDVLSVLTTSSCTSKTDALPTCGPWSSSGASMQGTTDATAAPSCSDSQKNGSESDVDCGGTCIFKCGDGKSCNTSADCAHAYCGSDGKCATPTCSDNVKNGTETDVDCGGTGGCAACAFGKGCSVGTDCTTRSCSAQHTCGCPAGMVGVTPAAGATFCVDADEVTNAQYAAFLAGSPSTSGQSASCSWNSSFAPAVAPGAGKDNLPVANVDWCDAFAYCTAQGKRLCGKLGGGANAIADYKDATKSQWFDACSAGGTKTFPYGNAFASTTCNGAGYGAGAPIAVAQATQCQGGVTGLFDMSGNVSEWEDSCDAAGGGNGAADNCRARGGAFSSQATDLQCDANFTYARSTTDASVGFRCCAF